jgi:hypothetical protein
MSFKVEDDQASGTYHSREQRAEDRKQREESGEQRTEGVT